MNEQANLINIAAFSHSSSTGWIVASHHWNMDTRLTIYSFSLIWFISTMFSTVPLILFANTENISQTIMLYAADPQEIFSASFQLLIYLGR
jgi:hypothetical protein